MNSIEKRIIDFIDEIISIHAVDESGVFHLPMRHIVEYVDELAALWFQKYDMSFDFLLDGKEPRDLRSALLNLLRGIGDRKDNQEDIALSFAPLIFDFHKNEILELIGERVNEYEHA